MGDYYITTYRGRILSALCNDQSLIQASFSSETAFLTGTILIGRILNKSDALQAVFVEIAPGRRGFLPYANLSFPDGEAVSDQAVRKYYKQGDDILVQISKAAVKTKDPVLTTNISLSGNYAVISRTPGELRYPNKTTPEAADCLKNKLTTIVSNYPYGICLQTGVLKLAGNKDEHAMEPVLSELTRLKEELDRILAVAGSRKVFSILSEKTPAYLKRLLDTNSAEYERVITDEQTVYQKLKEYFSAHEPAVLEKLQFFEGKSMSLLNFYRLGEKIEQAFSKKVWLKCGGYLVIEPTEALIAIDVNTGKFLGKGKDREKTFFHVNLEAAKEAAIQIRSRNLSGMILIDFINMQDDKHKKELLKVLRSYTADDPVPTRVVDMTALGLVEITRKKVYPSLEEQYYETDKAKSR